MNRRIACILLVVAGMALGYGLRSYETITSPALAAQTSDADEINADILDEVKEIKTQVKELNTFLQSGKMRVIAPIYPDSSVQ